MRTSHLFATGLKVGLILFLLGVWADGSGGLRHRDAVASDSTQASATDGISITPDNQILVELTPDDTASANLFDLNGRTLVFTPDGAGGYSRKVQSLAWEEDIGKPVADGAVIALESFAFDFAGQSWDSLHVSRSGLMTFDGPFTYAYTDSENRFKAIHEIAAEFVNSPTISPLYKPLFGRERSFGPDSVARQHVAQWPDRVVVTWHTTDRQFDAPRLPPEISRFQAVLHDDGSIRFNYTDIAVGDGVVGLFPNDDVVKGDLIARVVDSTNAALPVYLDLLEAAIYETSNADTVILEFTTRGSIPEPGEGTWYSYRLYFDTDRPWWTHLDFSDEDFASWQIDVKAGGEYTAKGHGVKGVWASDADNRIALLADGHGLLGTSASVIASALQFDNDRSVREKQSSPTQITFPLVPDIVIDLSESDRRFSQKHSEVFRYPNINLGEIACRVIDVLGDRFDLFVFHSEFRIDSQENGSAWRSYRNGIKGLGLRSRMPGPCGEGRLLGHWAQTVLIDTIDGRFDAELALFAHEFIHTWGVSLSYEKNGEREPLYDGYCQCHWRRDLHTSAAFPWHGGEAMSIMDGRFWRDNGDGTFTPITRYTSGGPSWLDLYLMGLADASEVPDMFILRNLQVVAGGTGGDIWWEGGVYTGEREIISVNQIIAAEGPREPSAAESQKDFNAGFVYLVWPGQTPSPDLLDLHAEYRNKVQEHWFHITGRRSLITTNVNGMEDATLENPRAASFQSGVGVISGWACHANKIVIELNGVPYRTGYGTTRPDTQDRCGDTNNGFSLLWNWNNLGAGTHTVRALIDGQEFANTTVRVTTFGEGPIPAGLEWDV